MRQRIFRYLFPPLVIGGLAALQAFIIEPAIPAIYQFIKPAIGL